MLTESVQLLALVTTYLIILLPTDTPVTTPLASIVATLVLTLFQLPIRAVFAKVVVLPTPRLVTPVIAGMVGNAFTVTVTLRVAVQVFGLAIV